MTHRKKSGRILESGVDNLEEGRKRRSKKIPKSFILQGKGKRILEVEEGVIMIPDLERTFEISQEVANTTALGRHNDMDDVEDDFVLNNAEIGEEMTKQVPSETLSPPKNCLNYD